MLVLLLAGACSNGHLDAFSREVQSVGGTSNGGASNGGAFSGGASNGGATFGGGPSGGAPSGGATNGGGTSSAGAAGQPNGVGGMPGGPLVLDDFEDGDARTLVNDGWWYVTRDLVTAEEMPNAIVIDPSASDAHTGAHALRVSGGGCKSWCFLGVDLRGQPYLDGRAYSKLSFWARLEPGSVVRSLSIDMLDGTNVNDSGNPVHFRNVLELTPQWGNYTLNFSQLVPTEGSPSASIDRGRLAQVEFWIFSPDAFDFSLDDVVFLP